MARLQGNQLKNGPVIIGAVAFAIVAALLFWMLRPVSTPEPASAAPDNSTATTTPDPNGAGSNSATPDPTSVAQTLETPLPTATTFATPVPQQTPSPTLQSTPATTPIQTGVPIATSAVPNAGGTTLDPNNPNPTTPTVGATAPPLMGQTEAPITGATVAPTSSGY